jgi:hypothetical protein
MDFVIGILIFHMMGALWVEFTKSEMKMTKGVAILFMLLLHLFCRKEVNGLYDTSPLINGVPFVYYIGLFGDVCVPIYCFASGYGLFISINNSQGSILKKNVIRILKLLINYWIILVAFVALGFFVRGPHVYPGSITKFFLNFFVLSSTYNGAWWFLQTYIILVFLSPLLTKIIKRYNTLLIIFISGSFYFLTYIQRIEHVLNLGHNAAINMMVNAVILVGTSQLPFIIGSIFAKEKFYSKIYKIFNQFTYKNTICIVGIIIMFIFHSFYQSMIIAPITGTAFVCLFNLLDKKAFSSKLFDFFGNHSTNIWLTHMFFYMMIFPNITFAPHYPIFIYCWLILLCIISSFIIDLIYKSVINIIYNKFKRIYDVEKAI